VKSLEFHLADPEDKPFLEVALAAEFLEVSKGKI
jgi:hypothetical protein